MKYILLLLLTSTSLFSVPKTKESIAKEAVNEMKREIMVVKKSYPALREKWSQANLEDELLDDLWDGRWEKIADELACLPIEEYDLYVTQILEEIILFSLASLGQIEELYQPYKE